MQETRIQFLVWEDALEQEMATHSSILSWETPWTEETARLQFMGPQKSQTRLSDWARMALEKESSGKQLQLF